MHPMRKPDEEHVRSGLPFCCAEVPVGHVPFSLISTQEIQKRVMERVLKRILDITIACIGLIVLSCLLPFIALYIFCEDGGSIFYHHQRIGFQGRPFRLYKLRSMKRDADVLLAQDAALLAAWQQQGKLRHDPRVTSIGRFLRRWSIDELPQMLNVLRGEMSVVGPRPLQQSELVAFGRLISIRQSVKPGLTGLWQINGRSETGYEQRCVLDCLYALEHSLWVDIHILHRTFPALLSGSGAY